MTHFVDAIGVEDETILKQLRNVELGKDDTTYVLLNDEDIHEGLHELQFIVVVCLVVCKDFNLEGFKMTMSISWQRVLSQFKNLMKCFFSYSLRIE